MCSCDVFPALTRLTPNIQKIKNNADFNWTAKQNMYSIIKHIKVHRVVGLVVVVGGGAQKCMHVFCELQ